MRTLHAGPADGPLSTRAPVARPSLAPVPLTIASGCAVLAMYGTTTGVGYTYSLSCLVAAIVVAGLETNRLARSPGIPWWVVQILTLPWVVLVIVPWTARIASGQWQVGIEWELAGLDLPFTWSTNLVALLGFAAGTLVMTRDLAPIPSMRPGRVRGMRAAGVFALLALAFLASFVVAGRPFGSLWVLSGEYFYSQSVNTRTSFGPLELVPTAAVIFVIALAALRRGYRRGPTVMELIGLVLTALVTLGSGSRSRFILLMLGWVFAQFLPSSAGGVRTRRTLAGRPVAVLMCGLALAGAFLGLGVIANARANAPHATTSRNSLTVAVDSLDVVGSSELLVARGAKLGSLRGRTYTELPGQFIPRAISGGQKQKATALQLVDDYLDPRVGYSAPYWMESALNFGRTGTFVFCLLLAAALARVQRAALCSRRRLAQVYCRAGSVALLLSYELLSRLSTEQLLYTGGSFLAGAWLASRTVPGDTVGATLHPSSAYHHPPGRRPGPGWAVAGRVTTFPGR